MPRSALILKRETQEACMLRESIISAILGGAFTALLTLFPDEIKAFILGKHAPTRDLIGKWNCTWKLPGRADDIKDYVIIRKIAGERVQGIGKNTESGDYILSGRLSPSNIFTLTYYGVENKSALGGVVILDLKPGRDVMEGHWAQFSADREFLVGTTHWQKA